MNFFTSLIKRLQPRKKDDKPEGFLREFVYLDEVSVYSLIASRIGSVKDKTTDSESTSQQNEIEGAAGVGLAGTNAGVNIHVLETQTKGSQVVRKSIIQTSFKELYENEIRLNSLAIQPLLEKQEVPKFSTYDDFIQKSKDTEDKGWIINPDALKRGKLIELTVQLETEKIFRISALATTLLEIVEEDTVRMGLNTNEQIVQIKTLERILGKLLVGLVPIRGQATDYCIVELKGKEWIVHRKLLDQLKALNQNIEVYPLYVVGVAEQSLFWKDIRRILFSNAQFSVFCRLSKDSIHNSWTPIKLTHVLEKILPDLATEITNLETSLFNALANADSSNKTVDKKQEHMHRALKKYAQLISEHHRYSPTSQELSDIESLSVQYSAFSNTSNERQKAFNAIATFLHKCIGSEFESLVIANYRADALTHANLDFSGNIIPSGQPTSITTDTNSPEIQERFLDAEFIAIYW